MSELAAREECTLAGQPLNLIVVDIRPGTVERMRDDAADRSGTAGPLGWHLWKTAPADGVRNMAVDAALLRHAGRTGHAVWRFYSWTRPTLSFGRNETTFGRFDTESVACAGFDAVRRPTGGRALLHSREVTYSVALSIADDVPWRAAYASVNALLERALRSLGIDALITEDAAGAAITPTGPLCFALPSAGEITVGGAKLVGSAVWRDRGAYLQHGSILLHDDQAHIAGAALVPTPAPPPAASLANLVSMAQLPQATGDHAIAALLTSRIEETLGQIGPVTAFIEDASLLADVARFDAQFRGPEWLWRR